MPLFSPLDHGAAGDGATFDTRALQATLDACHAAGGGRVALPAGKVFLTAPLELKSHVELHLEAGSRLVSSTNPDDFPDEVFACLLHAREACGIAVTGTGTIDGQAHAFCDTSDRYHYKGVKRRPQLIVFDRCRKVTMRDVTVLNSANWAIHPVGCHDVLLSGLTILNDLRVPNGDGIDPDHCRDVRISDCTIESADDCIVIKNRAEYPGYGPCENITVTGCTMVSTSCAVKLGTESDDDFRNIIFDACVIRGTNRALGIQLRDHGTIENVLFSNMIIETRHFSPGWWGRAEPIYVTAIHRAPGTTLGRVRHVRFSNVLCRAENGVFVCGSADSPIEDLLLENVRVEIDHRSKWPGGWHDRRPCMSPRTDFGIEPEKDVGLYEHPTVGFFLEHARGVTLRHCEVAWGEPRRDHWRHAIEAHAVEDLRLEDFRGDAAHEGVEAIVQHGEPLR